MELEIALISVSAYIYRLIKTNSLWITQQLELLMIFIIGLTFIGKLDVLLPIYFLASLVLLIKHLKNISYWTLFFCGYFGVYLLYGLIAQSTVSTIIAFVAKCWQFIVFFLVINSTLHFKKENIYNNIKLGLVIETLLGIYLLFTGQMVDPNGLVRLVSNSQPITGNLAIATLPLTVYLYFNSNNKIKSKIILMNLFFLVWIILSGTRGYLLVYALTMFVIMLDYFRIKTNNMISLLKNILVCIALLGLIIIIAMLVFPEMIDIVDSILRLNASVGIRTFENALAIDFFNNTSLINEFFGIGMGGTAGDYPEYLIALNRQLLLGMWHSVKYMNDSGVLFHNLYANVLLNFGVIGIFIIITMSCRIYHIINKISCKSYQIKYSLILYFTGFLLMNYYRWSADCGIGEMIILALVLKRIKQEDLEEYD